MIRARRARTGQSSSPFWHVPPPLPCAHQAILTPRPRQSAPCAAAGRVRRIFRPRRGKGQGTWTVGWDTGRPGRVANLRLDCEPHTLRRALPGSAFVRGYASGVGLWARILARGRVSSAARGGRMSSCACAEFADPSWGAHDGNSGCRRRVGLRRHRRGWRGAPHRRVARFDLQKRRRAELDRVRPGGVITPPLHVRHARRVFLCSEPSLEGARLSLSQSAYAEVTVPDLL